MKRPAFLFAAIAIALALGGGCARHAPLAAALPPPAAAIQGPGNSPSTISRGQGVWIGDRLLTAAHVLMPTPERPELASEFLLNGEPTRLLSHSSGDLVAVAAYGLSQMFTGPGLLEDWVVAQVSRPAPTPRAWTVWARPLSPGDTLYAVGFAPVDEHPELEAIPLRVMDLTGADGRLLPERLLAVRPVARSTDEILYGWSGAYVGLQHDGQWCYVGTLIAALPGTGGGHIVLRPPPEALQLLSPAAEERPPSR